MTLKTKIIEAILGVAMTGLIGGSFAAGIDASIHNPSQSLRRSYEVKRELDLITKIDLDSDPRTREHYSCLRNEYLLLSSDPSLVQEKSALTDYERREDYYVACISLSVAAFIGSVMIVHSREISRMNSQEQPMGSLPPELAVPQERLPKLEAEEVPYLEKKLLREELRDVDYIVERFRRLDLD